MWKLCLALPLLLTFCSRDLSNQDIVASYIAVQEALASDDYLKARTALLEFSHDQSGDLKALAEQAGAAEDIDGMRRAFTALSERMSEMQLLNGYVVAFCSMANNFEGAHWVQKEGDLRNPYFGASMLSCGEVVRKSGD